jgi:hypothetical protein
LEYLDFEVSMERDKKPQIPTWRTVLQV